VSAAEITYVFHAGKHNVVQIYAASQFAVSAYSSTAYLVSFAASFQEARDGHWNVDLA